MRHDRPPDLLRGIIDFIDRIESWVPATTGASFNDDEKTLYAVLHALQYIGEAVARLPRNVTDLAPNVPWGKIRAMRNLIAHDYAGVDSDIVWKTVRERLPELQNSVPLSHRCWGISPKSSDSRATRQPHGPRARDAAAVAADAA